MTDLKQYLNESYERMDGSAVSLRYSERHGIKSAAVLTVADDETASLIADHLAPRIEGKTVIEIGGGIGLLSLHMGYLAKRVFCIEANPVWSSAFIACLLHTKPKNVSFLFGSADEFSGHIKGDVALFCTHSGVEDMRTAGRLFAPEVIDVYGELIEGAPEHFDPLARRLRSLC